MGSVSTSTPPQPPPHQIERPVFAGVYWLLTLPFSTCPLLALLHLAVALLGATSVDDAQDFAINSKAALVLLGNRLVDDGCKVCAEVDHTSTGGASSSG